MGTERSRLGWRCVVRLWTAWSWVTGAQRPPRRLRDGISLVEVMMALVVLSIMVIGGAACKSRGSSRSSRKRRAPRPPWCGLRRPSPLRCRPSRPLQRDALARAMMALPTTGNFLLSGAVSITQRWAPGNAKRRCSRSGARQAVTHDLRHRIEALRSSL